MSILLAIASRVLDVRDAAQLGLPFWAWETIGLAGFFALVLLALHRYGRRAREKSVPTLPGNPQEARVHELAEAMKRLGTDDSGKLSARVKVWALPVEYHLLASENPRPYIDFVFSVANTSILLVDIGQHWDGRIVMDKTPLNQRLEVLNCGEIPHGETHIITVRQWLSDDDANDAVAWQKSNTLPFKFNELNLWMSANGFGFENKRARLALPDLVWLPTQGLMR